MPGLTRKILLKGVEIQPYPLESKDLTVWKFHTGYNGTTNIGIDFDVVTINTMDLGPCIVKGKKDTGFILETRDGVDIILLYREIKANFTITYGGINTLRDVYNINEW